MRRLVVIYFCVLAACGFEHGEIQPPDAFVVVPSVQFEEATSMADEASGTVQIGVVLSEPADQIVAVSYDVTGGNATRPDDYTLADGTLTFLPGQTRRTIDATILADNVEESDETVILTLSGPSNATIGATNHHTLTISADILPRVSFSNAATTSANEATDETVQAVLTLPAKEAVTVQLGVAGTATGGGVDHALTDGQVISFAVGESMKNVPLGVVQDLLDEDDETADLTLKNPTGKLLLAATGITHTHTITDDDPLPTVQFMAASSSTPESASTQITVTLTPVSGRTVTVPYSVTGGTANVADATVVGAPGTLTFAAGETSKTIDVMVMQDTIDEPDETVIVSLGTPTNATLGTNTTHTLTILDDDDPPTVAFAAATGSATEGDTGTKNYNLAVNLSSASAFDISVPFTVTGTATSADYVISASPLSFPAGTTTANVVVTVKGDTLDEANETVIVTLGTPTNATLGAVTAETFTINDDDATPTVSFTSTGTTVAEATADVTLTLQLSAISGRDVTVPFTVNAASTATNPSDYTITTSPVTIPAGQLSTTITIHMVDDSVNEPTETVIVDLDTPTFATLTTPSSYTLNITDNDAIMLSWDPTESDLSEAEGTGPSGGPTRTKTFHVVLSGAASTTVTVGINYSGTATGLGVDYTGPISASIPAGQTSAAVTLTIVKDNVNEPDETIIMTLGTSSTATVTTQSPTVRTYTLTNDDP